jgi:catechol 2,3-dioxygenase-like lactoylglutathione lyase family enzyme
MSTSETIFVAADESLDRTVDWLSGALGLERLDDPDLKPGEHLFRAQARGVQGEVLLVVGPNIYGEVDPEPGDVSAIDRYTGAIEVRALDVRDETSRAAEARAVFDTLAATQPDVALVLTHALSWIVAAYLPRAGVHNFPAKTSLDADAIDIWRPWVVG